MASINGDDLFSRVASSIEQRHLVMQEVLSNPENEKLPLSGQEFYELCIEESDDTWRPGFVVKQTHAQWNAIDKTVIWDEPEWERWPTLKKANEKYAERKRALATAGFVQSDMDF